MPPHNLSSPVGIFLRPTLMVDDGDSLSRAIAMFRENGLPVLPVVHERKLVGVITESVVAVALLDDVDSNVAAGQYALTDFPTIRPYESGAEALRRTQDGDVLVVTDNDGYVLGVVSPSDLWPRKLDLPRPPMVGGMATPFGVYLTTGNISGGVSKWALLATGAVMFTMLAFGTVVATLAMDWMEQHHVSVSVSTFVGNVLSVGVFLLLMRLVPLSGTHGAEHQVVHAIEREEELVPSVVSRMPLVHPRCGTNLAAAAGLFLGIASAESVISDFGARCMLGAVVTLFCWKSLGSFMQRYVTTKKPTQKQLEGGIRSGEDLLMRYAQAEHSVVSIPVRIWNSGLLHVVAGSSLMLGIIWLLDRLFHWNLPIS